MGLQFFHCYLAWHLYRSSGQNPKKIKQFYKTREWTLDLTRYDKNSKQPLILPSFDNMPKHTNIISVSSITVAIN